jgi:hypothetical protein
MNFDNKYGNKNEIKNKIIYQYHEYMYNYFINNSENHDLSYVYAGIIYANTLFDEAIINNKLLSYLQDNQTEITNEDFRDNFNIIDFMLGIIIIIPFGAEFNSNNELFGGLEDNNDLKKYMKFERINDDKIKLTFKTSKLLRFINKDIKFKFDKGDNKK